jgi:hypothetical protein
MEELLKSLGIKSFQEVEDIIRSVHLPRESGQYLKSIVPLPQICQLLYLMVTRDIEIVDVSITTVLVKHTFHKEDGFDLIREHNPELYELLNKSRETGFHILISQKQNILEYITKMKEEKSCLA